MNDAFGIVLDALLTPLAWFTEMLYQSGSLAIYLCMFLIGAVLRLFVRPILGEAHKDMSNEIQKTARENYKKLKGDG